MFSGHCLVLGLCQPSGKAGHGLGTAVTWQRQDSDMLSVSFPHWHLLLFQINYPGRMEHCLLKLRKPVNVLRHLRQPCNSSDIFLIIFLALIWLQPTQLSEINSTTFFCFLFSSQVARQGRACCSRAPLTPHGLSLLALTVLHQ